MGSPKKFWIVLVNRQPQGPYTEAELNRLLDSNQISRNEVGMLVSENGKEKLSGWQILWQFEEFDRRRKKKAETGPAAQPSTSEIWSHPAPPPPVERRRKLSAPEIEKVVEEKIPESLMEIAPEDLVPGRAGRGAERPLTAETDDGGDGAGFAEESETSGGSWLPKAVAGIVVVFSVVAVGRWITGWISSTPERMTSPTAIREERRPVRQALPQNLPRERTPLSGVRAKPQMRLQPQLPERNTASPSEQAPPPVDFGEVPASVFEEMEADAQNLRQKIRRSGRKRRSVDPEAVEEQAYEGEEEAEEYNEPPPPEEEEYQEPEYGESEEEY